VRVNRYNVLVTSAEILAPDGSPDWSRLDRELHCPLCTYNLRGLPSPRCPECGHRFDWLDILDPYRKEHPYIFEHHPERNLWSFIRTMIGDLVPVAFWTKLKTTHVSRPGRLIVYWALANLLMVVPFGLFIGCDARQIYLQSQAWQAYQLAAVSRPSLIPLIIRDFGSVQNYLNRVAPVLTVGQSLWAAFLEAKPSALGRNLIIAEILAWPWLTFLILMIFRVSMRQAKIKHIHVLRCILYSSDAGILLAASIFVLFPLIETPYKFIPLPRGPWRAMVGACMIAVFTSLRVGAAYSRYLRFDHPYWTALASQLIGLLFAAFILVQFM
jgi:hypothetical protein